MSVVPTTAAAPAADAASAGAAQGAPQKQGPNDQLDGDLSDWVKNFDAMVPAGSHASFPRVWSGVGTHEMFGKMSTAVQHVSGKLAQAAALNDEIASELKAHANKAYSERKFNAAIALYTRALMYAKTASTAAVIANNRAAVMLEQGLPLAALADAHYARRTDPTNPKPIARRAKCLTMLGQTDLAAADAALEAATDAAAASPSPAAHEDAIAAVVAKAMEETGLPTDSNLAAAGDASTGKTCFVNAAVFERGPKNAEKGHHVRAKAEAPIGTTILAESPAASAPRTEGLLCSCAWCHRQTMCLYPCAAHMAKGVRSRGLFCTDACAQASWSAYGSRESANPFWLACPVDVLLGFRLATRVAASATDSLLRRRFGEMREWSKEVDAGATVGGLESAGVCAAVAFGALDPLKGDAVVSAMRKLLANAVPVAFTDRVTPDGAEAARAQQHSFVRMCIAKAMYVTASAFNHSCDPNAFASFKGNPYRAGSELHVRLIRPVMEGEEICISYDGLTAHVNHSTRARIRDLRAKYGFACSCSACFNNVDEPIPQGEQEHYVKAADYYQKGRRLMRQGDAASAVDVLSQSLDMVMRYVCPPPRKPQFVVSKTHDSIAQAFQMLGNKAKCVMHIELSIDSMAKLQGESHVDLAREYAKLSTLCAAASEADLPGARAKATAAAEKAVAILQMHFPASKALEAEAALLRGDLRAAPAAAPAAAADE